MALAGAPLMVEAPLCFAAAEVLLRQLKALRDASAGRGPFEALFVEGQPSPGPPPYLRGCALDPARPPAQ